MKAAQKKSKNDGHVLALNKNIKGVRALLDIASRPKIRAVEKRILLRSAIVLFVACWEAFVEDLARTAFKFMQKEAGDCSKVPDSIKRRLSEQLLKIKDPIYPWSLAEDGWKNVLQKHGDTAIQEWVDAVNTPSSQAVSQLFEKLIGLRNMPNFWSWRGMSANQAKARLAEYIRIRGEIAHRVSANTRVAKTVISRTFVIDHVNFIFRLATRSCNGVRKHLVKSFGKEPWPSYSYRATK
ncbi:MAG: hypothetical protein IT405_00565 [Candidatus Yanofskybacteria bacterium]|nr:hypothetical protein [Candidatus Yanofskybacteria bacterium]